MGNIEHCEHGTHWSGNCAKCRARATTGYDFVSLQRDEMRTERDTAREQLRGAVEALEHIAKTAGARAEDDDDYISATWVRAEAKKALRRLGGSKP